MMKSLPVTPVTPITPVTRDAWQTPPHVFKTICEYWNIYPEIDSCADATNTKCRFYLTEQDDALTVNWKAIADEIGVRPIFWMNPPYSQPTMSHFILKALHEAERGCTVLYLLPAWIDQEWYHEWIKATKHEPWRGRIKFIPPPGVQPTSPRYGNIHGVIHKEKDQ